MKTKKPEYPVAPLGSLAMEKYLNDKKVYDKKHSRNFKLWNHWIAEVRDIAKDNKCFFTDDEDDNGNPKLMNKSALKWYFGKDSMKDYFDEGMTPQEAFEEEISHWEYV